MAWHAGHPWRKKEAPSDYKPYWVPDPVVDEEPYVPEEGDVYDPEEE